MIADGSTTTASDSDDSQIVNFALPATGAYLLQVYGALVSDTGAPGYTLTAQ